MCYCFQKTWIRIRILNTDPPEGRRIRIPYGSGSSTLPGVNAGPPVDEELYGGSLAVGGGPHQHRQAVVIRAVNVTLRLPAGS